MRRRFEKFVNVFSLFRNYLRLEKDRTLHFNKIESPLPKDDLCQVWLKLAKWFWKTRFFKIVKVFTIFCNYRPWKKEEPFILKNWISIIQGWFVSSLVEIGLVVLKEKIFLNLSMYFRKLSPIEKGRTTSFEQTQISLPKNDLCQVWVILAQWFWRRRFC